MLTVNFKQIYETREFGKKEWVLIIYDISGNHYVGVPVYSNKVDNGLYLGSIKKYVNTSNIKDYSRAKIYKCIYLQNKPLKISNKDYNTLIEECKNSLIEFLNTNISDDIDGIGYLKWCRDKYKLNKEDVLPEKLKQNGIYWVNMEVNVGSELRKLRPVILWRSTGDKKIWTMIPLTTKNRDDDYYFHYDLECLSEGSEKIENMMNYSYKRILAPYFQKENLLY